MAGWQEGDTCYWGGWALGTTGVGEEYTYGAEGIVVEVDEEDNMLKVKFIGQPKAVYRPLGQVVREPPPDWDDVKAGSTAGSYVVKASNGMAVLREASLKTAKPGRVEHGSTLDVVEVVVSDEEKVVYGRITEPEAWVVLLAGSIAWAERADDS